VGLACRVALAAPLGDGEAPRRPVDGERGPPVPVLAAEVDEERAVVVLDAQSVGDVALLVERAGRVALARDERRPAAARSQTIIPAPTVSFVASSTRMNEPVVRLSA
jgi:hypothetical protein